MKILIIGSKGMVGRALCKIAKDQGHEIVGLNREHADFTNFEQTQIAINNVVPKPDWVILSAGKVGGILANMAQPVEFGEQNVLIITNVLKATKEASINNLLFLASSCIFPRLAPMPLKEEYLMTGDVEPTNQMYALAKIFGLKMCQAYSKEYGLNFISVMPPNLYGEYDNYSENGHVIASMIKKFHKAKINNDKEVICWGDGSAMREIMYVDDMADACLFVLNNFKDNQSFINIGTGKDVTIKELALLVKEIVGYEGNIYWDTTKPNGMPRKVLDVSKLKTLGWTYKTELKDGLKLAYKWYVKNIKENT
jgi:GDP-L-fucose synthase